MAKYIHRDTLADYAYRHYGGLTASDIMLFPTIDVEPVKHGRWIDNGICDSMLSACSICGYSCGAYSFNYCPNCGARMDGESHA